MPCSGNESETLVVVSLDIEREDPRAVPVLAIAVSTATSTGPRSVTVPPGLRLRGRWASRVADRRDGADRDAGDISANLAKSPPTAVLIRGRRSPAASWASPIDAAGQPIRDRRQVADLGSIGFGEGADHHRPLRPPCAASRSRATRKVIAGRADPRRPAPRSNPLLPHFHAYFGASYAARITSKLRPWAR